jgi:hypothetical protein
MVTRRSPCIRRKSEINSAGDYWDKAEELYGKLSAATINIVLHH